MRSTLELLKRVLDLASIALGHLVSWQLGGLVDRSKWLSVRLPPSDLTGPQRLRTMLEDFGGGFIKMGQLLAMQPDVVPPEYCEELYSLLDRVTPLPSQQLEAVFLEEVGRSVDDVFDSFERKPLASGSIGQVHCAFLDGRKLAVKIQRPDAESQFDRDVRLVQGTIWAITNFKIKWLDWVVPPFREFATWTREELDFRYEARYMRQMAENSADKAIQYIPELFEDLSTARVMVAEFLEGSSVAAILRGGHDWPEDFDPRTFSRNITDNFLTDIFFHGLFHADLHPANIMPMPDNVVAYIDFGITGALSHQSRKSLIKMTVAYASKNAEKLCENFFNVSHISHDSDTAGFRVGIERIFAPRDEPMSVTASFMEMLQISRETRIWPREDIIKYIRTSTALDGLIRKIAPDIDVNQLLGEVAASHLARAAREDLISYSGALRWATASVELIRDGPTRMLDAFTQLHTRLADLESGRRRSAVDVGRHVLVAALLLALLASLPSPVQVGLNVATVLLVALGAVAFDLTRAFRSNSGSASS